ncbi:MAG TPA: chemotaxis protein CheB, partial [Puia sp.]|nr:chemotaxis protein CheB [Puia sp.]
MPSQGKSISLNLFPVVGVGASAGGLNAFKRLIKAIPEDSGVAYIFVQHLEPTHESLLVDLLQKATSIPVREITNNIHVEPNQIYIIPSNKMLTASDGRLELSPRPPKNERNMPIDVFFTSLAEVHQSHAIGVVLSGTATDGTLGLKAIKDHGGITFAQEQASAAFDGMPQSAIDADVVDFILAPEEIPLQLAKLTSTYNNGLIADRVEGQLSDEDAFRQLLTL